jgi:hypothetical protein
MSDPSTAQSIDDSSSVAKAKGLSISYTDNIQGNNQTATIDGRVSYLLFGINSCHFLAETAYINTLENGKPKVDQNGKPILTPVPDPLSPYIQGFGFAPFVSSNGTWNEPSTQSATGTTTAGKTITITTKKTSNNALRGGADFQMSWFTPGEISQQFFYVSPFYQTDYRGLAQIDGVDLVYEPTIRHLLINEGYIDNNISYLTQFSAEAEFTHVYDTGLTQLVKGQHAWIGETARPNLTLFPGGPAAYPDAWFNNWVAGRISLIGTQQFFWDADTGKTAAYYQAVLQYKLGACTVQKNPDPDLPCKVSGSSSISLEYDWGRNKDTDVKSNQILVKLGYSY